MKQRLLIMGSGGFASEAFSWLPSQYDVIGFFSELPTQKVVMGLPVITSLDNLSRVKFLLGVGDPLLKEKFWDMAMEKGLDPCTPVVHHTATVGVDTSIEEGSILCPGAVVTSRVRIGCGFLLNLNSTVGHDCAIGDFVTVSPGAYISGNVTIGDSAYIGTGSVIREKVVIGDNAMVGMGAVVVKSVQSGLTVVGNPARPMETNRLS